MIEFSLPYCDGNPRYQINMKVGIKGQMERRNKKNKGDDGEDIF